MQVLPTLALAGLLSLPTALFAQQGERYTLDGDDLAVYNLAGALSVEPGTGPLAVEVTRGGADAAKLRVEQGEIDDRETLRVHVPLRRDRLRGHRAGLVHHAPGPRGRHLRGQPLRRRRHWRDRHERREGRRVRISGDGSGLRAHADLKVKMPSGARLALYLAVGKVSIANVNGELVVDGHSAPITATGTKGSLVLDVGSGPVHVTGAEGELNVDTGSGSVEVTGFNGTELSIDTGSGGVTGSELKASDIRVETGSGDIALTAVTSPVLALETGSGSVSADLRGPVRELGVETGSGDISVRAPASLSGEVEIETASGGIETDFPLQITRHSRDHMVGQIGNGSGRIAIETGSGDVRLLKNPN